MRKFLLGFLAGAVLFSVSRVDASNLLEAVRFPVTLIINGKVTPLDTGHTILNYNGSAYVPVRLVGEALHAKVRYADDDPEKVISINDPRAELPEDYPEDLARAIGDVVFISQAKTYNEDQLTEFVKKVEQNSPDWIRIVRYTLEGDPIIQLVSYRDGMFKYTIDYSRDSFGGDAIMEAECSSMVSSPGELFGKPYTEFTLTGCSPDRETYAVYKLFGR